MQKVRVRFAPSPTGALHIGGLRTALYNYLLARKSGGTMILRIEDTDQNRFVPGAEEYIIESLKWAGIQIDEGPVRQSERKEIYKEYVDQLLKNGYAYYAFDTTEELEAQRKSNSTFQYDAKSRMSLNNSLSRPDAEIKAPYVIRFKVPQENVNVTVNDLIRGEVTFNSSQVDDKVLMKSDGMPTYHLANVVDDHLMEISHVIRGEEWLPSAPLHVLLYKYFGWADTMPRFAHLPLLLKPDGNGKLSKRDADKAGFPIFPLTWNDPNTKEVAIGYREAGYLPEAIINFLALLGWNPGTEQELFTMDELIEAFSLERIGKAGAKFDILKAQWFNQQYIKKNKEEVVGYLVEWFGDNAKPVFEALKDRVTFIKDFWEQGKFFVERPGVKVEMNESQTTYFANLSSCIEKEHPKIAPEFKLMVEEAATQSGVKSGQMMKPLRTLLTGSTSGPDLMATMEILGSNEVLNRIKR
ncbi:MAG: glutamate--tRNA ligase [Bacteroidota bacterium]